MLVKYHFHIHFAIFSNADVESYAQVNLSDWFMNYELNVLSEFVH